MRMSLGLRDRALYRVCKLEQKEACIMVGGGRGVWRGIISGVLYTI